MKTLILKKKKQVTYSEGVNDIEPIGTILKYNCNPSNIIFLNNKLRTGFKTLEEVCQWLIPHGYEIYNPPKNYSEIEWLDRIQENFKEGY